MPDETKVYGSAEFLDSEEAILAYLDEALESGDAAFIAYALNMVARASGLVHENIGTTADKPDLASVLRIMKALGLRLSATPVGGERR